MEQRQKANAAMEARALEGALQNLVDQIRADDYRARIGSPLIHNTAFLEAVALLDMRRVLQRTAPPSR